nr:uncharacterized protein LOC111419998 [Onthophagus taurus]
MVKQVRLDNDELKRSDSRDIESSDYSVTFETVPEEEEDYFTKFNTLAGWQSILLMQFQIQMKAAILFSIYVTYIYSMVELAYAFGSNKTIYIESTPGREAMNSVLYTGDVIYALDCLSMLIFKRVKWKEIGYRYKSRPNFILTLEIISLIPLGPFYSTMVKPTMKISSVLRLRYTLRLVRLHSFFIEAKDYVGRNSYLLHLFLYVAFSVLLIVLSTTIAYIHNCNEDGSCNEEPNYEIYTESLYVASAIWTFVGCTSQTKDWVLDNVLVAFIGFLMVSFFNGYFVCGILRKIRAKCCYINTCMWQKKTIAIWKKDFVKEWTRYHKKYEVLMEDYAGILWERTRGIYPSLYLWKFLPPIMYKEIFLDTCWVPLKHSHLFRNEEVYFLRLLSQRVEQRFFCPGEIIYRRDKYKTCMVYIVSGTVDILSEEDGETPIMSLSSGSCLGESSIIISYPSTSTVMSRDMCDAVILHKKDFVQLCLLYPEKMKRVISVINLRYVSARSFKIISEFQFNNVEYEERVGVLTMKWLKHTLRSLLFNVRKMGDLLNRRYLSKLEENVFCTKYLDLLAQAEDEDVITDTVFIKTQFPFVFRPNSVLTKLWNAIVLTLLSYLLISYPWFMVYYIEDRLFFEISFGVISFCWIIDLYLRSSIAIKTKYYNYNTVSDILIHNFSSFTYLLDIFAAIPWEVIFYLIEGKLTQNYSLLASANRLVKVYKLEQLFTTIKVETNTLVLLTITKFSIYLIIFWYYFAAVCFMLGRSSMNYDDFMGYVEKFDSNSTLHQVFMSMFGVIEFYCDLDVAGFPFAKGTGSKIVLIAFQYILECFNICFIAYLAAIVTMNRIDKHRMQEYTNNMEITMQCYKLNPVLQKRVWRYIDLQYRGTGIYFLISDEIFAEIPKELAVVSRGIHLGDVLKNVPLFYYLEDNVIYEIANVAMVHLVPENEVIVQIGEFVPEIYILIQGVCRMENFRGEYKLIEQNETFNALEACLDVKSLVTIRTETPCSLVTISIQNLKAVLLQFKLNYDHLETAINSYPYWSSVVKVYPKITKIIGEKKLVKKEYKYFGYFLKKRTKKYAAYKEGFTPKTAIFKPFLLRIVFSNNGKFVYYWEFTRGVFIYLTILMIPLLHVREDRLYSYKIFVCDLVAYIDIILRHNFSYYNEKGLEVMHPMKTAKYYWSHAFALDLFASLPFAKVISLLFGSSIQEYKLFQYNRFLQIYRFRYTLNNFFDTKVHLQQLMIYKYLPYVLVTITTLSSIFVKQTCSITLKKIDCTPDSSLQSKIKTNTSIADVIGWGIYITTSSLTYSNHYLVQIGTTHELIYISLCAFLGMILIYLLLAKGIENCMAINRDLSVYQEAMQRLNLFLSYRKIDKHLKNELINHFEYRWKRTKGKSIHKSFKFFKRSFKVEALYNIYGILLTESTIFPTPNEGFFRSLLLEVEHEMYLKRGYIYRVNDVNDDVFILLKGNVHVVGADGNRLTQLSSGSIFGNLDNCPVGRRTLSIIASSHVDVLRFSSAVLFRHLANFDHLHRHFKKLTQFDTDYIPEKSSHVREALHLLTSSTQIIKPSLSSYFEKSAFFKWKIFNRNLFIEFWEKFVICYVSYCSYFIELYHLTTLCDSYLIYCLLYSIDLIFLIKIYLMFHTAYEDEYGIIIKNHSTIAKRYIKMKIGFILDVFTTLPLDVFMYAFQNTSYSRYMYPILRLNRLPRIVIAMAKLRSLTQKLNVTVLFVRMWYLVTWTLIAMVTIGSTLLFFNYKYYPNMSQRLFNFLTCIQYVINSCISTSKSIPIDKFEINWAWTMWISTVLIFSKAILLFFITECCSILIVVNHTRNSYEQFMIFIKSYLHKENISIPLTERVIDYSNLLWAYHKGVQFPVLLDEAPYYLKEALLDSMFGFHLNNHPIMKNLHKDLTRQMTARMKTLVFFPGDKVTYVGDIDRCMYFIDEGEVVALSEDTMYSEVIQEVLHVGEMFGMQQGILYNVGHNFTYKVTLYTVLVALKRDDWIHLLDFYPASKHVISQACGVKLDRVNL